MLLRRVSDSNGQDLLEVSGGATQPWDDSLVTQAIDALALLPKWCVCRSGESASMFLPPQAMAALLGLLQQQTPAPPRVIGSSCLGKDLAPVVHVTIEVSLSDADAKISARVPATWLVKDVVVALSVYSPAFKHSLECYHESALQLAESESGRVVDFESRMANVVETSWTLVSTRAEYFCVLRGFPFGYDKADVLTFMWANGM